MGESIFTFLFKYRPVVFARGDLAFALRESWWALVVAGVLATGIAAILYMRTRRLARRDRIALTGLRTGALALLLFCLAAPVLLVATVVPQQNFLAVLLDDSQSMGIGDVDGRTRAARAAEWFDPVDGALIPALAERFKLRIFRFSETTSRFEPGAPLTPEGRRTALAAALDQARRELAAVPLAGVVVVTDGGDNGDEPIAEALVQYRAAGLPIHAVGLGSERFAADIELAPVRPPAQLLEGARAAVDVRITHTGFAGRTVPVLVEADGAIVGRAEVRLPRDGGTATARVHFTADRAGPRRFRFHVPPQEGELITRNNGREMLIRVDDRRERMLYFEGEPRFEVKFLRRALADDRQLDLVVLQRTADNKFLRLDVADSAELAGGFPRTREELFRYRGLVLGSVEASFFTHDQLRMIADFVSQRGGGLLVLGGRRAFNEGGYAETPLADVLPVVLDRAARDTTFFAEVRVEPTPAGRGHPAVQLGEAGAGPAKFDSLPPLSVLNRLRETKAGAATLLLGRPDGGDRLVILATQRYGRGVAAAFPVQDSWMWQMHADIALDDQTHETLWRQLLRWLVSDVPDPVVARAPAQPVAVGEGVTLAAEVTDSAYLAVNGAEVVATITDPDGDVHSVPLAWTVERDGEYRGTFPARREGLHTVRVESRRAGRIVGTAPAHFTVGSPETEFFGAQLQRNLLERLADETGGGYYSASNVAALPEDVEFTESGATVRERRDLWDMPIVLILLLGCIGAEWTWRRVRGLA